ncbi:MAG: nucleotidyl transferase AbiEii/AbiGii toxin family protein, partial [Patescibacteria group bacterium]
EKSERGSEISWILNMSKDNIKHEIVMNRLLSEILDDKYLSVNAFFKGGTCAKMLGYLDRFSVDLDFDLGEEADKKLFRDKLHKIFEDLGLEIKDESKKSLQFFLRYPAESGLRNTIKLEILDNFYKSNIYRPFHIPDIERTATCQTIETMFSHKLIAPLDRKEKGGSVAGRDIYDIHYFFSQGYEYLPEIIKERRGVTLLEHLSDIKDFIEKEVTKQMIDEDLNALLDYPKFKMIRKYLKEETLRFIEKEIGSFKD